ncbi:hypothetical protein A3Q56_02635 [Intoshia linei]|uniref:G-protein coupled receptors family 1 profile domain-containing protein n=1 Tax=Intoshia linei TaxID=1819745 RepID=A0A177B5N9_9BILA|nr:hypothetical protein A3Q56_02635 [Intoshia linei]
MLYLFINRKSQFLISSHYELDMYIFFGCILRIGAIANSIWLPQYCLPYTLMDNYGNLIVFVVIFVKIYNYKKRAVNFLSSKYNIIVVTSLVLLLSIVFIIFLMCREVNIHSNLTRYTRYAQDIMYYSCTFNKNIYSIITLYLYRLSSPVCFIFLCIYISQIRHVPANWNECMLIYRTLVFASVWSTLLTLLIIIDTPISSSFYLVSEFSILTMNLLFTFTFGIIKIYVNETISIHNIVLENGYLLNLVQKNSVNTPKL